jgi:hypothetical protein
VFLGHFAVGLAAKRLAPTVSLGTLFLACQLADLVWPLLVLLGLEQVEIDPGATAVTPLRFVSYPFSHSLAAMTLWATLFASAYGLLRRSRLATLGVLAATVLSHWALDALSHAPDMPLTVGGATRVGLGLWRSLPATLIVEGLLFAAGLALYARGTRPADRTGSVALWALAGFLVLVYAASVFGPPPPSVSAVAWGGNAMWLLVLWGLWIDRHRVPRAPEPALAESAAA